MNTPIHKNLKRLRLSRGLTQEQLAQRVHLTRQAISSYESGRTQPNLETLKALAEALDADIHTLLYGSPSDHLRLWRVGVALGIVIVVFLCLFLSSGLWGAYDHTTPLSAQPTYALSFALASDICRLIFNRFVLIGGIALLLLTLVSKPPVPMLWQLGWAALFLVLSHGALLLPWGELERYVQERLSDIRIFVALLLTVSLSITAFRQWRMARKTKHMDEVKS